MNSPGKFVISIDLELAWGICDQPLQASDRAALAKERKIVERLLSLFQQYEIRATWAVVGHLLLTDCAQENGQFHPEIPRPVLAGEKRDWFFQHPLQRDAPFWFGRELVGRIRDASPEQEIGSHSFCHLPYDESRTRRQAVEADIRRCAELHHRERLPFHSFIFPRNVVGYKDLLARAGLQAFRGHMPRWYEGRLPKPAVRSLNLLNHMLARTPPVVHPRRDQSGLLDIPDSMLFMGRNGLRRLIPSLQLLRQAQKGLNRAVKEQGTFHLWFHPSNFAYDTEKQFAVMEQILRHFQVLRDSGQLENLTMGHLAQIDDRSTTT